MAKDRMNLKYCDCYNCLKYANSKEKYGQSIRSERQEKYLDFELSLKENDFDERLAAYTGS